MRLASIDPGPRVLSAGVIVLVCLLWSTAVVGVPAGSEERQQQVETDDAHTFALYQGDRCAEITALGGGTQSISERYDYRTPYTDLASYQYASFGTTAIQRSNTSQLFVYRGRSGYSLVFLHDSISDDRGGGAISANVSGLPPDGEWVVEDDRYPGRDDVFSHENTSSHIEWVWNSGNRTDGGAFRGLTSPEYRTITIDMQFNDDSARYPFEKWSQPTERNRITTWIARSGTGAVYPLTMNQSVQLRPGSCDDPTEAHRSSTTADASTSSYTSSPGATTEVAPESTTKTTTVSSPETTDSPTQRSTSRDTDPTLAPLQTTANRLTETVAPSVRNGTTEQPSSTAAITKISSESQRGSPAASSEVSTRFNRSDETTGELPPQQPADSPRATPSPATETESSPSSVTTQAGGRANDGAKASRTEVLMYVLAGLVGGLTLAGIALVHRS